MEVEDLKNTKIYLSNKEDRIKFQESVFKLGVRWCSGDTNLHFLGDCFYFIDEDLVMSSESQKNQRFFINSDNTQIFLNEILNIVNTDIKQQATITLERLSYHFLKTDGEFLIPKDMPFMNEFLKDVQKLCVMSEKANISGKINWKSVEDRMPPEKCVILVQTEGGSMDIAKYCKQENSFYASCYTALCSRSEIYNVTKWAFIKY